MKKVTIIAKHPLDPKRDTEILDIKFNKNTTLSDITSKIENDLDIFTFSDYYPWSFYWLMIDGICPYIKKDGKMIWNVSYQEVLLVDFLNTHCLTEADPIIVYVDNVGGAGDIIANIVFQSWSSLWFALETGMTLFSFMKLIKDLFGITMKHSPSTHEIKALVLERDVWTPQDLSEEMLIPEEFAKLILDHLGYEEHEGSYWKNSWKVEKLERKIARIDYNKYVKEYIGYDLAFHKDWDLYMNEEINSLLLYAFELLSNTDRIEEYDELVGNIETVLEGSDMDSYEKYEYIRNLVQGVVQNL